MRPRSGRWSLRCACVVCPLVVGLVTASLWAQTTETKSPTDDEPQAPELTREAEQAIDRGLAYLLKSQNPDGSWSSKEGKIAIGGTSLGLMAFMVRGHFPGFGRYGDALDRAKNYLLQKAKDSPTGVMGGMYEHGLFTIAMSEMWGMTGEPKDNQVIQAALERAVQIILRAQSSQGGWRYAPRPDAGQDTSVTAMVFVSLASAREAGILVPTETIDRVTGYLRDQVWNEATGGFGYQGNNTATIACTAGGVYAAQLAGNRDAEWVTAALNYLENNPKVFSRKDNGHFYYSHYYAMQAMVQSGDERYAKWYPKVRDALIALQKPDGSWQEQEEDYPHKTPMAIIILGTPHRYIPVYQR
ncbi:MAG: hypothetical protein GC164_13260 [Phycisphaera sp.]|nr:hypothetical protein [Phycisphaera sp.]